MSFPYAIRHEGLELNIAISNIEDLYLHEEIVPDLLEQLTQAIDSDGYVKHPIIVDGGSLVVLDGMHRVAALKHLELKRVPVCFVDYENPAITVGCWYRAIQGSEIVLGGMKGQDYVVEEQKDVEELEIGVSTVVAVLKTMNRTGIVRATFDDLKEAYDIIREIEEGLRERSFEVLYKTEDDALRALREGKVDAVLLTPRLTKESIVRTARSGKVFSYKATRHVVPARPLHVDVPVGWLGDDLDLTEVNDKLGRMLRERCLRYVSAGNVFGGRRYEEDLYVFE